MVNLTCGCELKTAVAAVSVCGYFLAFGLFVPVVLIILTALASWYNDTGALVHLWIITACVAFLLGLVPPILHRRMTKAPSEAIGKRYAYAYLLCFLFGVLFWTVWMSAYLMIEFSWGIFFGVGTPFVLEVVYGFFVIKSYADSLKDPSASQLLYNQI